MSAPSTRVDTETLKAQARLVSDYLDQLERDLLPLLVVLTAEDRETMPRTRTGFREAALTFSDVVVKYPEIVSITGYDAEAVQEDLANAAIIAPLLPRLKVLTQMVQDSVLQWDAEAQEPTLAAYGVAKERAKRDGSLAPLIQELATVLSNSRRSRAAQ